VIAISLGALALLVFYLGVLIGNHPPHLSSLGLVLLQRLRQRRERGLQDVLRRNANWVEGVQNTPTLAEQYGLDLPPSAWVEWRQGNADAGD
jgi:hypothetical protein